MHIKDAINPCTNRGSVNYKRFGLKIGKQKCPYCGASINVQMDGRSEVYALIPVHERPLAKTETDR